LDISGYTYESEYLMAGPMLRILNNWIQNVANPINGGDAVNLDTLNTAIAGVGGSPASPTNSVQFNLAGAFGGSANLTWDNVNNRFGIGTASPAEKLHLPAGTATAGTAPVRMTSGVSLTTASEYVQA